MYESHFGFRSRPFSATPDANHFYPNESARRAFESVCSCVERATGAALVVGGSGLGKSTLLQAVARHFQNEYSVAILESASINSRKELLQNILFSLGLPFHGMEEGELRLTLMDYLKPSDRCPNGLLLCVDEAHLLTGNLLEEMRMITNLVRNGQPRARLVLAGNPSIEERLAEPQMESLSQRISTRAYLEPCNSDQCRRYVSTWLEAVGKQLQEVFDEEALEAIFVATHGIPRLINQVCDHALVLAVADGLPRITQTLINEAWSDIQRLPVNWNVLGAQTEQPNEHVIEFGDFEPEESSSDQSTSNDSDCQTVETVAEMEADFSAETKQVDAPESAENLNTECQQEDSEEPDQEPENQVYVFNGPRNPFNEKFEKEEQVIDQFSQIIGHIPQQPNYPGQSANRQESVSGENKPDVSIGAQKNETSQSSDSTGKVVSSPAFVDMNVVEKVSPEPESEQKVGNQESGDNVDAQESLDEYLGNTRDAISFGVGQGVYSNQFDSPTAGTDNSEQPSAPMSEGTPAKELEPEKPDSLESEINETVKEMQRGMTPFIEPQSKTDPAPDETVEDANASKSSDQTRGSDDRDMIVIEEETKSKESEAASTVPIRDNDSESTTPQAKREDYKQLFDRLRNG